MKNTLIVFLLFITTVACTPKLLIKSEPSTADVYLSVEGRIEKIKAGTTPLEITELQINELLQITSESTQWIQITLEKKDFEAKVLSLPSNRWGEISKNLNLRLSAVDGPSTTATKMLNHFFNAKKFAETKQFPQAHAEIDKIISIDSKMPQALTMKAGIYYMQGSIQEAKGLYLKALELDPSSNEAIQMLERIKAKAEGGSIQ